MLSLAQAGDDGYKISTKHSSIVFDFNELWDMEFPEEFTSVYVFYNRYGWMGEGWFYAVYECEQPNEEFLKDFNSDLNTEVQENIERYFENFKYNDDRYNIKLDKNYMPDFEEEFISISYHKGIKDTHYIGEANCEEYCDDHLYMSYFPQQKLLYIYERIT